MAKFKESLAWGVYSLALVLFIFLQVMSIIGISVNSNTAIVFFFAFMALFILVYRKSDSEELSTLELSHASWAIKTLFGSFAVLFVLFVLLCCSLFSVDISLASQGFASEVYRWLNGLVSLWVGYRIVRGVIFLLLGKEPRVHYFRK